MPEAMCHHCGGDGCSRCDGGTRLVVFAEGYHWSEECPACGVVNGGGIFPSSRPPTKTRACVFCGAADLVWVNLGPE